MREAGQDSEFHALDGVSREEARGFAFGLGAVVHDEVAVDARVFALVFVHEQELEADGSAVAALVAADGDEFETGAGADDIDDAAGGMGDV